MDNFEGGSLVAKSCPTLATPWTVAHQALLSMGFSRQEYWSGWPGIETGSPALQADSLQLSNKGSPLTSCGEHSVLKGFCPLCLLTLDPKLDSGSWFLP